MLKANYILSLLICASSIMLTTVHTIRYVTMYICTLYKVHTYYIHASRPHLHEVPIRDPIDLAPSYLYELLTQLDELVDVDVLQSFWQHLDGVGVVHVSLGPGGLTATLRLGPLVGAHRLTLHQQRRRACTTGDKVMVTVMLIHL